MTQRRVIPLIEDCCVSGAYDLEMASEQELARCDTCKWWGVGDKGKCFMLDGLTTEPDFFCGHWEPTVSTV